MIEGIRYAKKGYQFDISELKNLRGKVQKAPFKKPSIQKAIRGRLDQGSRSTCHIVRCEKTRTVALETVEKYP
jgi:hypothetical protein